MKSKVVERIMAEIEQNTALKVEFTIVTKRHGFMKWLEDKDFIVPHKEHVVFDYNKMGKPTHTVTTFSNRSKVEIKDLEIRHNYKYYR
jgi:hypothetical protein